VLFSDWAGYFLYHNYYKKALTSSIKRKIINNQKNKCMKNKYFIYSVIIALASVVACSKESSEVNPGAKRKATAFARLDFPSDSSKCQFIPVDSANKMINSYLYSINSTVNDSDLRSLIINADSIRAYLNVNPNIRNVKIMFAHTLNYINAGYGGQYAGYQSGALTIIMAGYDGSGNYVYMSMGSGAMVIDHALPCPASCPGAGTAAYDILE
jgi:hypothetical protein